jgi:hypothetical protein
MHGGCDEIQLLIAVLISALLTDSAPEQPLRASTETEAQRISPTMGAILRRDGQLRRTFEC